MSNALAVAGVTAVIKDLLDSGMIEHQVTDAMGQGVTVSAVAPDTIPLTGPEATPRLNLFLHKVTPNGGWRNVGLPSHDSAGNRVGNPPLALDLHYVITAYGTADLQAEVLLGYAMQLLHETPVFTRQAIRTALNPSPVNGSILPTIYQALRAADLADQVEQIKITPATVNTEEMSQIWSALQAHYRPTAAYQVSVVLIESQRPARSALPVLSRGPIIDPVSGRDRGVVVEPSLLPPLPTIDEVRPPNKQPAARLGDTVDLIGHHLDGTNRAVRLENVRFQIDEEVPALATGGAALLQFTVPNTPAVFPVGIYQLAASVLRPGETSERSSNQLALVIAPEITTPFPFPPANLSRDPQGTVTIKLSCRPEVRPGQRAELILGDRAEFAEPFANTTADLTFLFPNAPPAGSQHLVRLRMDGIESLIIDRAAKPPVFFNHRVTLP
jgi:Pvc16 N-terminal domain